MRALHVFAVFFAGFAAGGVFFWTYLLGQAVVRHDHFLCCLLAACTYLTLDFFRAMLRAI